MVKLVLILLIGIFFLSCNKGKCNDGKLNGKETGIDCGGDCVPCATCNDGIKNQNEVEIDCGGECQLCAIKYPVDGHFGVNILDGNTTHFLPSTQYSLHAELPDGTSLKIIFTNTSADINTALWFYIGGSEVNLIISSYNESTGIQTFESVAKAAEVDLSMSFGDMGWGPGSAIVDVYENESSTPTWSLNVTW